MRLFQPSADPKTQGGSLLEHYLGNMSETLVRARAEEKIRSAHAAAEASIRARSLFLENMNHELRTPLNAIIGFASMLKEGQDYALSNEQKTAYSEYILQSADLLLGHINTILEVAALDNNSVTPSHESVEVNTLLRDAIQRVDVRAQAAKVSILTNVNKAKDDGKLEPIFAWADNERIAQAVDHLLQAAIKSCHKGGKVFVRTSNKRENWTELQIRDDGSGFNKQDLAQALNAFGDTHRGLTQPFTGPGVGIAIAKTFVEMQGGEFSIKSKEGKGTLSSIALPLAAPQENTNDNFDDVSQNKSEHSLQQSA